MKEQNKSLNLYIELGQYRKTQPIQKNSASRVGHVFLYWPSFSILTEFVIGMMQADLAIQILY